MECMRFLAMLIFLSLATVLPALSQSKLPEGPGKAALLRVCKGCHPPETVAAKRHSREEWEEVVVQMLNAGATGSDDDLNLVVDYLTEHFNKAAKVNVNKATVSEIVEALGLSSKDGNAIVAWREKNGAFQTAQDLKKVPGIDAAIIEAKKDQLQFQ
jgi:competence protein ComEA